MYRKVFKRLFDICISFTAIICFAIPMLIIAILVRLESKGPAVFKSQRVGKNNKPFKFYKFRSMKTTAPKDCATRHLNSDMYITRLGRILRKTSLDELPQLFNILFGKMSIIGPRPCVLSETDLTAERTANGASKIKPGLTGLAQINGRDALDMLKKAEYDGIYASKITFWGDVKIFFKTIVLVFKTEGIVEGGKSIDCDNNASGDNREENTSNPMVIDMDNFKDIDSKSNKENADN